jgi:hypothetical protein
MSPQTQDDGRGESFGAARAALRHPADSLHCLFVVARDALIPQSSVGSRFGRL